MSFTTHAKVSQCSPVLLPLGTRFMIFWWAVRISECNSCHGAPVSSRHDTNNPVWPWDSAHQKYRSFGPKNVRMLSAQGSCATQTPEYQKTQWQSLPLLANMLHWVWTSKTSEALTCPWGGILTSNTKSPPSGMPTYQLGPQISHHAQFGLWDLRDVYLWDTTFECVPFHKNNITISHVQNMHIYDIRIHAI